MVPIGTIDAKPVPFGWLGMLLAVVVPCSKCLVRFGTLVPFGTSEAKTKPHALLYFFGQLCLLCVVHFLWLVWLVPTLPLCCLLKCVMIQFLMLFYHELGY
jgi:hypothetical protein